MERIKWSQLASGQLGQFAEYLVKMEFTRYGFDIFMPELDYKGIDFIMRREEGQYYEIQVKSSRDLNYIFLTKKKFQPKGDLFASIVLFEDGRDPDIYLIPSTVWLTPNDLFKSYDYEGKKSAPEWGLNLSKKNLPLLKPFRLDKIITHL